MAFPSSTITTPPEGGGPGKHDVFVSFRGADTRYNFVSFLHRELVDRNGIETYIDYRLGGGEEIEEALLKKIEESLISLVIFSKNYADSTFCLRELSKILECKEKKGQIVVPVFYHVDPTDIQELQGSYADGLAQHEGEGNAEEVESWRHALKEIANLKGWDSNVIKHDTILVDTIVDDIQKKLHQIPSWVSPSIDSECLVGIDSRIDEVESLLCIGSPGVLVVGLWGMPGIGKTTLAGVVYGRISPLFEGSFFLRNVREESQKYGLVRVLEEVIGGVIEKKDLRLRNAEVQLDSDVKRMLQRKKVLIVLDDVSSCEQIVIEALGKDGLLGQGSRIILTSRDKQVVENQRGDHKTHKVQELGYREASQLFKLHAFKGNDQYGEGFKKMSERAVSYSKGNPLALKVLGSNLYNKDIKEWESMLANVKGSSLDSRIQKILMMSYDGLDWKQKRIFLDIACFFRKCNREFVQYTLDQCGFDAERGIDRLIDMCLLNISNNKIWMHDLLRQLGQDIVHQENFDDPRKRSRLWIPEDIDHVLTHYQGTETVQAISLDLSKIQEMNLSPTVFQGMCNLRLLKFYFPNSDKYGNWVKLLFPEGLEFLPKRLRILHWDCCPLESMPSKFCPKNLVQLRMRHSSNLELWNEVSPLVNLKLLEVTWSQKMTTIDPVLSKTPNLEVLILVGCQPLGTLDLSNVLNLEVLDLSCCKSLEKISSIKSCVKLTRVNLRDCRSLRTLCSAIGHLSQLIELDISNCESLHSLPSDIGELKRLKKLYLAGCLKLASVPKSIGQLECLKELDLSGCLKRSRVPGSISSLVSLKSLDLSGTNIESLPVSIKQLSKLTTFILRSCPSLRRLPDLPSSLQYLDANGCSSLESVAGIFTQAENDGYEAALEDFDFTNCLNLCEDARLTIIAGAKLRIRRMATSLFKQEYSGEPIGFRLCVPGNRIPKGFSFRSKAGYSSVKVRPHCYNTTEEEFLGFAFCSVVARLFSSFDYECHLRTESGPQDLHFSYERSFKLAAHRLLKSKHLFIWYDRRIKSNYLFNEASFNFYYSNNGHIKSGIHLLFAQEDPDPGPGPDPDPDIDPDSDSADIDPECSIPDIPSIEDTEARTLV